MDKTKWKELIKEQVWIYEKGENTRFTVLLMAGIHPEEEAGVFCLHRLLHDVKWLDDYKDLRVIMVPCRNLYGFNIRRVFRPDGTIIGSQIFEDLYCRIMKCNDEYLIFLKKVMLMESNRIIFWKRVENALRVAKVKGFVHLLSYRKNADLRANTYFFSEKKIHDVNVIGKYPKASFLCDVQAIVDNYKPNLVIDLHEGKGNCSYVYVDSQDERTIEMGKYIIEYFNAQNIPIRRQAADRIKIGDAVYALDYLESGKRLIDIVQGGKVIVLETGIERNLESRIKVLRGAVEQCMLFEWNQIKKYI